MGKKSITCFLQSLRLVHRDPASSPKCRSWERREKEDKERVLEGVRLRGKGGQEVEMKRPEREERLSSVLGSSHKNPYPQGLLRGTPTYPMSYVPGTILFFWCPKVGKSPGI